MFAISARIFAFLALARATESGSCIRDDVLFDIAEFEEEDATTDSDTGVAADIGAAFESAEKLSADFDLK